MPPRRRREHKGQVTEFTRVISERRLALGKTQAEIARAIGVSSPEFIGMVEAGLRRIDLNRVPMLARALNYDPAELCKLAVQEQAPELFRTLFGGAYSFTPKELSPQEVNTVHVSRDTRELLGWVWQQLLGSSFSDQVLHFGGFAFSEKCGQTAPPVIRMGGKTLQNDLANGGMLNPVGVQMRRRPIQEVLVH